MKDITKTPTADLIAEWGKFNKMSKHSTNAGNRIGESIAAIAAELDRRCSEAGIGSKDGKPTFRFFTTDKPTEELVTEIVAIYVDSTPYTLEELHALLGWLLLKEGGGNA